MALDRRGGLLMVVLLAALVSMALAAGGSWKGSKRKGQRGMTPCAEGEREFMPAASVREDGSAWDPETSTLYPNGTYFTERVNGTNSTVLFGCPCKLGRPCMRKCCQMGMAMNSQMACVRRANATLRDGGGWFRPVLSERHGKDVISVDGNTFRLGLLTERPCPRGNRGARLLDENVSYVRASDANLCVIGEDKEGCVNVTRFCHDFVEDVGNYQSVFCPLQKRRKGSYFRHSPHENFVVNVFKFFTQTVSSFALIFIVMLYALVPDLRSMHGKCHMSHAISLLVYYSMQNVLLFAKDSLRLMTGVCIILGPAEIYFYLAPLSWLNVMSLDIMLAFLCLRPITHTGRHEDTRKFVLYSLYAWGVPALVLLITIFKDLTKDERPTLDSWCETGTFRKWDYRKYPMYTLLTANAIIFALTAYKIFALKRDTAQSMSHDSRRHSREIDNNTARTKMYFRLLILMGFHWVLEPLAKALHTPLRLDDRLHFRMIWYFIAIINRLQGVFILIMFLGNGKLTGSVWRKLFNSHLWVNLTNKIVEISSSSNKTTSGIELEEGSSGSKAASTSKRSSVVTFVDLSDLSAFPSREARTPSLDAGEIPTISKLVEGRARKRSSGACSTPDSELDVISLNSVFSLRQKRESVSFNQKDDNAVVTIIEEEGSIDQVIPQQEHGMVLSSEHRDADVVSPLENNASLGSSMDQKEDATTVPTATKEEDNRAAATVTKDTENVVSS